MANIPVVVLPKNGAILSNDTQSLAVQGVAQDDFFVNDGNTIILIFNTTGGALAQPVTIEGVSDAYGRDGATVVNPADGDFAMAGPFRPAAWNVKSGVDIGKVEIDAGAAPASGLLYLPLRITTG